jgi:hypothetical protein
MSYTEPTLGQLAAIFGQYSQDRADASLARVRSASDDPEVLTLRPDELRRWLNQWLCRLRYPRPGEADPFADSLCEWWAATGSGMPSTPVAGLGDEEISLLADSYCDLASRSGALRIRRSAQVGCRRIAPTAASKIMFVLRPDTVPPWDAAIACATTGGVSRYHFSQHLTATRTWANAVLSEAVSLDIRDISAHVGRPRSSVAKLRDE